MIRGLKIRLRGGWGDKIFFIFVFAKDCHRLRHYFDTELIRHSKCTESGLFYHAKPFYLECHREEV